MKRILIIARLRLQVLVLTFLTITSQLAQAGMTPVENPSLFVRAIRDALQSQKRFICSNANERVTRSGTYLADDMGDNRVSSVERSDDGQPIFLIHFYDWPDFKMYNFKVYAYVTSDESNTKIVSIEYFYLVGKEVNVGTLTEPVYEMQFQSVKGWPSVCRAQ